MTVINKGEIMKRRKRKKKQAVYFLITLVSVLGAGTLLLFLLFGKKGRKEEAVLSENVLAESVGRPGEKEGGEIVSPMHQDTDRAEPEKAEGEEAPGTKPGTDEPFEAETETGPVTMAFGGDVCFHDEYANMYSLRNRGGKIESSLSADLLEEMRGADILMVNNEFSYSNRGEPLPGKAFTFRSRPENVKLLHEMGVDIVSLANNHVYDWGEDALFDTLDTLKSAGIPYIGAGRNLDEAKEPYYFEINGRIIAFVSATQVERNENPDTKGASEVTAGTFRCFSKEEFTRLLEVVKEADEKADLTVVYIHWGTENTDELHWAQEWQAPELVKAGADLIVGDHPHCLQGIDFIDGVPVFYSIGNFWFNSKKLDTGLLKVILDEDGKLSCQFLPALQHDCRTDLASGGEKQRILQYLQCISPDVTIDENGIVYDVPYSGPPIDYNAVQRVPQKRKEPAEDSPLEEQPSADPALTEQPPS